MENFKEVCFKSEWTKTSALLDFKETFKKEASDDLLEKHIDNNLRDRIIFEMFDCDLFEINKTNDGENYKVEFKCFFKQK
jgi:hypothetical protein